MKIRHYTHLYWSFGFIFGRDCVLQQFEPYEVVKCWEPHLCIYAGQHMIKIYAEVPASSWLGRRWGKFRQGKFRVEESPEMDAEF